MPDQDYGGKRLGHYEQDTVAHIGALLATREGGR
jgi:hypothetical protein